MSSISKQALKVANNQSFPDNNTGYITPSDLRAFNVDMIDSTVNQATYSADIAEVQSDIAALEAFTASQQPSFAALNSFTSSQLNINSGVNSFTQSATGRLNNLENTTSSLNAWSSSINQIIVNGASIGTSTRFFFNGYVSASIVPNVDGPIASITILADQTFTPSASFNAYTQSNDAKWSTLGALSGSWITESETSSFARTNVTNTFTANQTIAANLNVSGYVSASAGFKSGPNTTALEIGDGSNARFISGSSYYNVQLVPGVGDIAFSRDGDSNVKVFTLAGGEGNNTTFQNNPVVFNDSVSSLTINAQSTAISGSGSYTVQASTITENATSVTTNASASVRGTFSVTGQSGGDGRAILLGHSGSLVLGNSGTNTYYADLAHLSSSAANANTNLIFKTNTNTADTIISSSANIFVNPSAPTAGFKRYMTGGNISIGGSGAAVPQISGSMGFSPTIANNYFGVSANPLTLRGPVSASAYAINNNVLAGGAINLGTSAANNFERAVSGLTLQGNLLAGTINAVASKTPLSSSLTLVSNIIGGTATLNMDSSSIGFSGNSVQGGLTINNSYFPSTSTAIQLTANVNGGLYIGNHTIYTSGSNTTFTGAPGRTITNAVMLGTNNVISASLNGDLAQVASTTLIGQGLVVVGSNSRNIGASAADWGSAFVGRWNDITGTKDQTAETVFAVGTGTGASTRRTGLLVDSGSNTIVEGSFTVTGSIASNVVSASIASSTASIDFNSGSFFTLTLPASANTHILVQNVKPGQSAMSEITTAGTAATASFSTNVYQPSASFYVPTNAAGNDILTFSSFSSSRVYLASVKTMINA